jgi:hypothetical protein
MEQSVIWLCLVILATQWVILENLLSQRPVSSGIPETSRSITWRHESRAGRLAGAPARATHGRAGAVEPISKRSLHQPCTVNRLERTLAPSKYTTSGAADDRLCLLGGDRRQQGASLMAARYPLLSSGSSAERSSVRAFVRITSAASSRESPAMSVSHTNASMPSVAPIP